jgi:hypothetical protein
MKERIVLKIIRWLLDSIKGHGLIAVPGYRIQRNRKTKPVEFHQGEIYPEGRE